MIATCVRGLARQAEVAEILVVDDQSEDGTAGVVRGLTAEIPQLRLLESRGLPAGWLGKNNAAWTGASDAANGWLLFTDADAELLPNAVARGLQIAGEFGAALVSFSPEQVTEAWYETVSYTHLEGIWEHEISYTTAPGTEWMWPRCFAVGGKTNFWGRSAARMGDIDFQAASLDGFGVNWPVKYEEIAPYYTRVEKLIGVAGTVQNRPSNPDGEYLPQMNFRCFDWILQKGAEKVGVPYLPDRIAQLTVNHEGHPACHFCGNCTEGCDTGSFFSTPRYLLPAAEATKNLELRTNALARNILVDENGRCLLYTSRCV